jgi:hypothetical protein
MEIRISSKQILTVLQVLSWIIFVGLCFDVGCIIFNTGYAHFRPSSVNGFWNGSDLSALYAFDKGHFFAQATYMIIASVLKALIFYLIIKLFYDRNLTLERPFNPKVISTIGLIAWICVGTGLFSLWGVKYALWLQGKGITMPTADSLRLDGGDVWLFMAVVLAVVGQVFKKGIVLQTESDLTV